MSIRFHINEQITTERAHIRTLYSRLAKHAEIAGNGRTSDAQREAAEAQVSALLGEIAEHRKTIVGLQLPPRRDATPLI